jgi:hypothetical protein
MTLMTPMTLKAQFELRKTFLLVGTAFGQSQKYRPEQKWGGWECGSVLLSLRQVQEDCQQESDLFVSSPPVEFLIIDNSLHRIIL